MYQIIFTNPNHQNNLFHNSIHKHLNGAKQIVVTCSLSAHIIDSETGELVYEYQSK